MSLFTFLPGCEGRLPGLPFDSERVPLALFNRDTVTVDKAAGEAVFDESIIELALSITEGLDDDHARLVAIYDWVTLNIAYDLDKAANLSAYGSGALYALENKSGVCHDFAELTRALLLAVGIEATYERGEVAVAEGEFELHAWNEAVVSGTVYALDTTWGSGFMLENKSTYIQKPRRLYLTSPEELALLHSDPRYKQEREEEYLRAVTAPEPVFPLPDEESKLLNLFNSQRGGRGLSKLYLENRLTDLARRYAEETAEAVCAGHEVSLGNLSDELSSLAQGLNIRSAAMHVLVRWLYSPLESGQGWESLLSEQAETLEETRWQGAAIGVVEKGDLMICVTIFLQYH